MKKKIILILVFASSLLFGACTNNEITPVDLLLAPAFQENHLKQKI